MIRRALNALYARLGPRYPRAILLVQAQAAYVLVFGGVVLLTLYQHMSAGQFLHLLVVAEALMALENALLLHRTWRALDPVTLWLERFLGPSARPSAEETTDAWRTLATLPSEPVRRWWIYPLACNALPFSIYATFELGLPAYSALPLLAGGAVLVLYGVMLRFFALEGTLRPVLEDVARRLPPGVELRSAGLPLRTKLLGGLPAMNIITGVVVSGLSESGRPNLSDLGVDVLVAVIVAFTLSLELTLLLSRSILLPLQELRAATERVAAGDLAVQVPIVSADETGRLAQSFNELVVGLRERRRLHEAFDAFVAPTVTDRVLREGVALPGEEVDVTVLFLDIRGFTAFSERTSARAVVERLNSFFELVVPVLHQGGGHATSFVGDGLLAVFGAPQRLSDHADRAVAAALEIAALVDSTYHGELEIGVGVNSGPVVAGTIGGGGRVQFTVIGDTVNTAQRVESATRETGDTILITEHTSARLTRRRGIMEPRPGVGLVGKRDRVDLFALLPAQIAARRIAPKPAALDES